MMIDTHCHLYKEFFDNIDEVLHNAKENNVNYVISCGDNLESSMEVCENSNKYSNYYFAIGIHPEHQYDSVNDIRELCKNCKDNKKLVAIGEIGLDYHYDDFDKDAQIKLLDEQLSLAEEYDLPVIIHSREATLDTINILKKHKCHGVIHCFSGSIETAREYLKMGYYIGVGGVLTFKNAKIKDVIKEIPIDRLLLETDSPFLAPTPYRGEKNEPKYIKDICEFLADVKGISKEEIAYITTNNAKSLFNI